MEEPGKRVEQLALLVEVSKAITACLDREELFSSLAEGMARLMAFDRLEIALLDREVGLTILTFAQGRWWEREAQEGDLLCPTLEDGEPRIYENLQRKGPSPQAEEGMRSGVVLPLLWKGEKMGALCLWSRTPSAFSQPELGVLEPLAQQLSVALKNAYSFRRLQELLFQAIAALSRAIENKFPYAVGHSQGVAEVAAAIARQLGFPQERVEAIRMAGLLHDVGKIDVLESILNKPEKLTYGEYLMVQRHPLVAEEMLRGVEAWSDLLPFIRHHHEWYDGMGYPDGLSGEEIPQEARILAVADSIEAMGSKRPHRPAMEKEEILATLKEGAGSQWDPQVVEVALEILQRTRGEG